MEVDNGPLEDNCPLQTGGFSTSMLGSVYTVDCSLCRHLEHFYLWLIYCIRGDMELLN